MTNKNAVLLATALASAAASCGTPLADVGEPDHSSFAVANLNGDSTTECPSCSSNAATIGDQIVFRDLNWRRVENSGGVRIVGARWCTAWNIGDRNAPTPICLHWNKTDLFVQRDGLWMGQLAPNNEPAPGSAPVPTSTSEVLTSNLIIDLAHRCGARYELVLLKTEMTPFWTKPTGAPNDLARGHHFLYRKTRTGGSSCPGNEGSREINTDVLRPFERLCAGQFDETQAAPYTAFIFDSDFYDLTSKTVTEKPPTPDRGWFNLACAGTAMAKMHLLRHTGASASPLVPRTRLSDRQAMLKMLTADYCGTGLSFTENGTRLRYMDAKGLYTPTPGINLGGLFDVSAVEGIWNEGGAICLNTPRLRPRGLVESSCATPPPECSAEMIHSWTSYGDVLSVNPIPAPS
jgi:hypothetical protein